MPKNLQNERKYILECKVANWGSKIAKRFIRWWWSWKLARMSEGDVLKEYRDILEWKRPIRWLSK